MGRIVQGGCPDPHAELSLHVWCLSFEPHTHKQVLTWYTTISASCAENVPIKVRDAIAKTLQERLHSYTNECITDVHVTANVRCLDRQRSWLSGWWSTISTRTYSAFSRRWYVSVHNVRILANCSMPVKWRLEVCSCPRLNTEWAKQWVLWQKVLVTLAVRQCYQRDTTVVYHFAAAVCQVRQTGPTTSQCRREAGRCAWNASLRDNVEDRLQPVQQMTRQTRQYREQ